MGLSIDKEKVVKGLQAHADGCGYRSHHCDAMDCPYRYGDESCDIEEMCRDALALLKEQGTSTSCFRHHEGQVEMTAREEAVLWLSSFVKNKEPMTLIPKQLIRLMYDALKEQPEVIRCKDCKHRPIKPNDYENGFDLEFPDNKCPCQCDDGWYSWYPADDWFCADGERKPTQTNAK